MPGEKKKIEVLHLIDCYLPASQVWYYNLLTNTPKVSHHIATRQFLPNNFYHPAFSFLLAKRGAFRQSLSNLNRGWLLNKLSHLLLLPLKLVHPPETREWQNYLQTNAIQLIHVHFAPYACKHLTWLQQSGVPYVVSFYGYDYEKAPHDKPDYLHQYQQLFQTAAAVICEGPHGMKTLQKMGCPEGKLRCVPLGIDLSELDARISSPKESGQLKLLQIADFTPKKGQIDTIQAALAAKTNLPELELTLVGNPRDGAYFTACQDMIIKAQASSWIKHIPFVPYHELTDLIGQHHLFIHPSKYAPDRDCEGGAPTILFNVQAMGMPVLSTRHCDIPAVVKDGLSGRLVPEGQTAELTKQIRYFGGLNAQEFEQWQRDTFDWGQNIADVSNGANALVRIYTQIKAIWGIPKHRNE